MCVGVNVSVLCSQCHIVHKDLSYMRAEQHPTFYSQEAAWGSQHYSGGTLEPDHFLVLLVSSANDITRQVKASLILLCLNSCVSCQNSSGTPPAVSIAGFPFQIFAKFKRYIWNASKSQQQKLMEWCYAMKKTCFFSLKCSCSKVWQVYLHRNNCTRCNCGLVMEAILERRAPYTWEQQHMGDFWGGDSPRFHTKIMNPKQQNDLFNLSGVMWCNRTSW